MRSNAAKANPENKEEKIMNKTEKATPSATHHTILHYARSIIWLIVKANPRSWLLFEFATLAEYCWYWLPFYWACLIAWIEKYQRRR